jgi:hypothetical protein
VCRSTQTQSLTVTLPDNVVALLAAVWRELPSWSCNAFFVSRHHGHHPANTENSAHKTCRGPFMPSFIPLARQGSHTQVTSQEPVGSLATCLSLFLQWHRVSRCLERGDLGGVPTRSHDRNREGAEAEQFWPSLDMHGLPQSQVQGASTGCNHRMHSLDVHGWPQSQVQGASTGCTRLMCMVGPRERCKPCKPCSHRLRSRSALDLLLGPPSVG